MLGSRSKFRQVIVCFRIIGCVLLFLRIVPALRFGLFLFGMPFVPYFFKLTRGESISRMYGVTGSFHYFGKFADMKEAATYF